MCRTSTRETRSTTRNSKDTSASTHASSSRTWKGALPCDRGCQRTRHLLCAGGRRTVGFDAIYAACGCVHHGTFFARWVYDGWRLDAYRRGTAYKLLFEPSIYTHVRTYLLPFTYIHTYIHPCGHRSHVVTHLIDPTDPGRCPHHGETQGHIYGISIGSWKNL